MIYTHDGSGLIPILAREWEMIEPDTLQLRLQEGVSFTNGEPFNADAAAYSVAVQQARAWNFAAYMNRGRVAKEVAVAQFVSIYSWINHFNQAAFNLKTLFEALSLIPFPPVAIPARLLATGFKVADQGLKAARRTAQPMIQGAITLLDELNGFYAGAAALAITFASKAESVHIANTVLKGNVDRARLSALGAGVLVGHEMRTHYASTPAWCAWSTSSPDSPVRMRIASSTGRTKIFPSPTEPVRECFRIVSVITGMSTSSTTISSFSFGRRWIAIDEPR